MLSENILDILCIEDLLINLKKYANGSNINLQQIFWIHIHTNIGTSANLMLYLDLELENS